MRKNPQPHISLDQLGQLEQIAVKGRDQVKPKSPVPENAPIDLGCLVCQKPGEKYGTHTVDGVVRYTCCQVCCDTQDPLSAEIRQMKNRNRVSPADYDLPHHQFDQYEGSLP